jgi:atypical dual specificity phosphatase
MDLVEYLQRAVAFIKKHSDEGNKVYVHCKAGHGRSAAVVFAWLMYKDPKADLEQLNKEFCLMRNVRKKLWKQKNILEFHSRLQNGDIELTEMDESYVDSSDTDKEL